MHTLFIVMGSMITSSLLWIIPLLLLDKTKPYEESAESMTYEENADSFFDEQLYADTFQEEIHSQSSYTQSSYTYSIVDEMINTAFANKVVIQKLRVDFAFSKN